MYVLESFLVTLGGKISLSKETIKTRKQVMIYIENIRICRVKFK